MGESLIVFTIGPVQRFIETARKTEDLWMGSYILSYLNGIAIKTLTENFSQNGPVKVIFPALDSQPIVTFLKTGTSVTLTDPERERLKLPTLPNRFLALDKSGEIASSDLQAVEKAVRNAFVEIAEFVFERVFHGVWKGSHAETLFTRQIERFLEVYWLIHPLNGADYKDEYNLLERKLGGVKSCRRFAQEREESRKCSLCGEREVIHFTPFTTENMRQMNQAIEADWKANWKGGSKLPSHKYLSPGEYLCAVCLTKRLGGVFFEDRLNIEVKGSFPSTAEVAASAFKLELMSNADAPKARTEYHTLLEGLTSLHFLPEMREIVRTTPLPLVRTHAPDFDIDGSWLFEETLRTESFIRYFTDLDHRSVAAPRRKEIEKTLTPLRDRQDRLRHTFKEQFPQMTFGSRPAKYYALIAMDGDNMGGKLEEVRDREAHSKISALLNEYSSRQVSNIVERDNLGKLLYAGGDDLMALANLKDLFEMLRQLRKAFPSERLRAVQGMERLGKGHSFGLSAGVCIAHYKTPLGTVRRHAKRMERKAKELDGKDAVAVALLKHSGSISESCCKWKYGKLDTMDFAKSMSRALSEGFSNTFLYALREEFSRLFDTEDKIAAEDGEILAREFTRLLRRRRAEKMTQDQRDEVLKLGEDFAKIQRKLGHFGNIIAFLELCNFIAREA